MKQLPKLKKYYQPIPFKEYENIVCSRPDSVYRYEAIKNSYGLFKGKTLLDIGCADGYFMWRFMKDDGFFSHGVEIDQDKVNFINELAEYKNLNVKCSFDIPDDKFDICFYLDLYGDSEMSIGILDRIFPMCKVLFVSRSGNEGDGRDKKLEHHLISNGCYFERLYKGFGRREILKIIL